MLNGPAGSWIIESELAAADLSLYKNLSVIVIMTVDESMEGECESEESNGLRMNLSKRKKRNP